MLYRKYGKQGYEVSAFGMGLMRLPQKPEGGLDYDESIKMIRYAIDNGVNYFDTAYVYHGEESEVVFGQALADGYREKVKIATKLPVWLADDEATARKMLETELERLQTDYIDVYLMHSLDKARWKEVRDKNKYEWLKKFKEEGLVKAIGFSFHDDYDTFTEILNAYEWDMCQLQMNYLDVERQATLKGIRDAYDKGLAVVIMEPLRGGNLINIPADVQELYDAFPTKRSSVEWAFKFIFDLPEVATVLSGVSSMEQLREDIKLAGEFKPNSMTTEEKELMEKVRIAYEARMKVPCTGCEYCLPCPAGVSIPETFTLVNNSMMYDDATAGKQRYSRMMEKEVDASQCVECGACEDLCPQGIGIIQELKEAHEMLA